MDYSEEIERLVDAIENISIALNDIHTEMCEANMYLKELSMCANGFANKYKAFPEQ